MNQKSLRIWAAAATAAIALGVAGTTAQAATVQPVRAESASAAAALPQAEAAQQLAANLLKYEGDRFGAQERAELRAIADGTSTDNRAALGALVKLLKKVKGFPTAVAKSYSAFKKWYNDLPWYVKGPLTGAGIADNLYDIWKLFH
ncbi:hypothetical protein ACQEVS_14735 [Streptomyces sp. CA-181903]|uniref:hypothetical protein n=1 Tax=Streptomyces sp. CA-181903 TaxID=3240055 RepID=UPI003D8B6CE8